MKKSEGSVFFIHVPKTAGTSIRYSLKEKIHLREHPFHLPFSSPVMKMRWARRGKPPVIACVRNPFDRAISIYSFFRGRKSWASKPTHRLMAELCRHLSLNEFWEKADIKYLQQAIPHLRPQSYFLEGAPLSVLLRMETLSEDWKKVAELRGIPGLPLGQRQRSKRRVLKSLDPLSDAAKARIRVLFADDFKNYYPDE